MKSFEWILYDIAVVWLIVGTVISSYKKGFSGIIISVCGYLLVCVISALCGNIVAEPVYHLFVKDSLIDDMSEVIDDYNISEDIQKYISDMTYGLDVSIKNIEKTLNSSKAENLEENLYNLIIRHSAGAVSSYDEVSEGVTKGLNESMKNLFKGTVPLSLTKGLLEYSVETKESAFELIKIFTVNDSDEISEYIEENYIRQYAISLVGMFVFIVMFFILMFVVKMVESSLIKSGKISGGGKFDCFAGAFVGIVEAVAYVFILCVLVKFFLVLSDDMPMILNEETIQNSKLFSIVYNFDILG